MLYVPAALKAVVQRAVFLFPEPDNVTEPHPVIGLPPEVKLT
jgi:hypothetical protein